MVPDIIPRGRLSSLSAALTNSGSFTNGAVSGHPIQTYSIQNTYGKWMNMAIPYNSKCQFGKWIYILIISDMHPKCADDASKNALNQVWEPCKNQIFKDLQRYVFPVHPMSINVPKFEPASQHWQLGWKNRKSAMLKDGKLPSVPSVPSKNLAPENRIPRFR